MRWAAGRMALIGLLLASFHVLAMMAFEDLSAREAVWLTMTTMLTVGYGDYAAKTPLGQLSTIMLLYLAGVFVAAQAASAWFDFLSARREAMRNGQWDWGALADHVVIVSPGDPGEIFFQRLLGELDEHAETRGCEVVLVATHFVEGIPTGLSAIDVKLVAGQGQDPDTFQRASIAKAAYVLILAERPGDRSSDGTMYDLLSRVRELNPTVPVLVEAVDDRNRKRFKSAGATAVVRPVRAYPEITLTALLHPGSSDVVENLVTGGGERIALVNGKFRGRWNMLVQELLESGTGLPVAVRLKDGAVLTAPASDMEIDCDGLYVLKSA
jgi:voltage-gated potassium channel